MRLPKLETDFWELHSGEAAHAAAPATFWIPEESVRRNLVRGQGAKLIFEIEAKDRETSRVAVGGERMWVIVAERLGDQYVGVLDSTPATFFPSDSFYLCEGAEVPFGPEHVIDIDMPPSDYAEARLAAPRLREWPRE